MTGGDKPGKGDRIEIAVSSLAYGGSGVGRHQDLVVFVPFTACGDELVVEIAEVKSRYCLGRVVQILSPSPRRTEPRCRAYGLCGGCRYQHLLYEEELWWKKRQVDEILRRIGLIAGVEAQDIIPSPADYHYRGKVEFHVASLPGSPPRIGFKEALSDRVVDLKRCEIAWESINEDLEDYRKRISGKSRKPWPERLTFWSRPEGEGRGTCIPGTGGLIDRRVKGVSFSVPADGFFQANVYLTEKLVETVAELAGREERETIVDGYCGSGLFSLFLAPRAKRLVGLEANPAAVSQARANLARAGFSQGEFHAGDVGRLLMELFVRRERPVDLLILDPPRLGLGAKTLAAVSALKVERIVYISCNPASLASDLKYLIEKGFALGAVCPLDMFPRTGHIEVAALVTRE